jgi:capsular polysaccharide biosynthesis protein
MRVKNFLAKILGRRSGRIQELIELSDKGSFNEIINLRNEVGNAPREAAIVGYAFYQLGKYDESINYLSSAINGGAGDFFTSLFLGVSYYKERRFQESVDVLMKLFTHRNKTDDVERFLLSALMELPTSVGEVYLKELLKLTYASHDQKKLEARINFLSKNDDALFDKSNRDNLLGFITSGDDLERLGIIGVSYTSELECRPYFDIKSARSIQVVMPRNKVYELWNVRAISGSSIFLFDDNYLYCDTLTFKNYREFVSMANDPWVECERPDALLCKHFDNYRSIDSGIAMFGYGSRAYGHWFADFIPRLRFYENLPNFKDLQILVDNGMPDSHYEFLSMMVHNKIIRLKEGITYRINRLYYTPADTFFPVGMVEGHLIPTYQQSGNSVGGLKYIKSKMPSFSKDGLKEGKKIYLSRSQNSWRKVSNENEIVDLLRDEGFQIINIENLNFAEQVKLMQEASVIVAPFGSALDNVIFCNPDVKVIVLGQKNLFNWGAYFGPYIKIGYRFSYINAVEEDDYANRHSHYKINIHDLKKYISDEIK